MIGDWLRTDPDEQEVEWIPSRWRGRVDISTLPEHLRRGKIKRRDLFGLAGSGDRAVQALLIGVVAWGSGNGVRRAGFSDGDPRGPWRAQQALSLPASAEAIARIRSAMEITREDGGRAAYAALSRGGPAKLAAMGESFFTKLIYVSGHRAPTTPRPLPLILDTNVRKALVRKEAFWSAAGGLCTGLLRRTGSTCSSRRHGPTCGTCVPTGSSTHSSSSARTSRAPPGNAPAEISSARRSAAGQSCLVTDLTTSL